MSGEGITASILDRIGNTALVEPHHVVGPGATVVTLMADSGIKYLSTGLYG